VSGRRPGLRTGGWAPNLTPQSAVRIATLGGIIVALLAILVIRLWFLQIIGGEAYAARADSNFLKTVVVEAPRGNILDREGQPIVANRPAKNIVASPIEMRGPGRERILGRLAKRLNGVGGTRVTREELLERVEQAEQQGQPTATLLEDVPPPVVRFMAERWREYRGVSLENAWVRTYPQGALAAHIVGSTGKISPEQLRDYRSRGYLGDEVIGVGGLEEQYEPYLRGIPGRLVYEVEASGEPRARAPVSSELPRQGSDVRTGIDSPTQRALQDAIARYSETLGSGKAAGVALDVRTGEVRAIASHPTFDPRVFVDRRERQIARLYKDEDNPMLNRVTQGTYPAGSTFKIVTATAGIRSGFIGPYSSLESPSFLELYNQRFQNFRFESHGTVSLPTALEVSSDTFFYQIGDHFWQQRGTPLQDEARRYSFGSRTGIDLPSEAEGNVPDPRWKRVAFRGPNYTDFQRSWVPGDTIQLTVGQGFFLSTPLQLAVAYATIANGGTVLTPTIGSRLVEPSGRVAQRLSEGRPTEDLGMSDEAMRAIHEGLVLAANGNEGTARAVFGGLPSEARAAGKTGTAETGLGTPDHSWFAGYAPADDPEIVVAVVIENAGTGGSAAAPAVCETFAAALDFDPDRCGSSAASTAN
jgi:penicillin-binding protein 2